MAQKTCRTCRWLNLIPLRCGNRDARPTLTPGGELICRGHALKQSVPDMPDIPPPPPVPKKGRPT